MAPRISTTEHGEKVTSAAQLAFDAFVREWGDLMSYTMVPFERQPPEDQAKWARAAQACQEPQPLPVEWKGEVLGYQPVSQVEQLAKVLHRAAEIGDGTDRPTDEEIETEWRDWLNAGHVSLYFNMAKAAIAALSSPSLSGVGREAIAKLIALAGLGRVDGEDRKIPPNDKWEHREWERRILECMPLDVEQRCYELADAILALLPPVPAGWRVVPDSPSATMLNAAVDATGAGSDMNWANLSPQRMFEIAYRAMISTPPAGEGA